MDAFTHFIHQAATRLQDNVPLLRMELLLLVSALAPIYAGAHASLSRPSSAAKAEKDDKNSAEQDDDEDDEEDTVQKMEGLSPQDAVIFPLTAGLVLGGLYWAIKTYGADLINLILGWYFTLIGVYSMAKLGSDTWLLAESFITPTYYKDQGKIWKLVQSEKKAVSLDDSGSVRSSPLGGFMGRLPLPTFLIGRFWVDRGLVKDKFTIKSHFKNLFDLDLVLTPHNVISAFIGTAALLYSNLIAKPWWLTNIQGFAVCYGALQLMSPTTFATGSLILSGLFCYDIWAVFFTPLMVTVAKNLDVPIKMLFPRPAEPSKVPGDPPTESYSMLGLGDIVLPGIMIALALRYDLYLFYLKKQIKVTVMSKNGERTNEVKSAPYVSATGHWGDKFHLHGAKSPALPAYLSNSFPKVYFNASIIGYITGMVTTLIAMTVSQHAQPALLYLVPGVLGSLWGTSLVRGELSLMWHFSEALGDEQEDNLADNKSGEEENDKDLSSWTWLYKQVIGGTEQTKEIKDGKADDSKANARSVPFLEGGADDKRSETTDSTRDPDTIFSFTITRRNQSKGKETQTTAQSKSAFSASNFEIDDAVIVASDTGTDDDGSS